MKDFKSEHNFIQEKKSLIFEVLKTPQISIREEREAQFLSFIFKAGNPEWGNNDTLFSDDAKEYFSRNPLDSEVLRFLDEINAFQEGGVDEEVLYTLALTYGHPERNEGAFLVL
ncbi:MAG: hypothetical protein PHW82_16140 [Bacteroidales bacterium]|nr:hypothetical protein [Bacteroidales bacterium]